MFSNYPGIARTDLGQIDAETQQLARTKFAKLVDSVADFVDKDGFFSAWEVNQSLLSVAQLDEAGRPRNMRVRDAVMAALIGAWVFQNRTTDADEGFLYALPFLEQALNEKGFHEVPALFNDLDTFFIQRSVGLGRTFAAVLFPGFVDTRRRGLLEGARGRSPDDGLTTIAGWLARTVSSGHSVADAESFGVLSKTAGYFKAVYPFICF